MIVDSGSRWQSERVGRQVADQERRSPPRLFGIQARDAPVVAVLRRGPSEWWQVGRWDLARLVYEPGAWFHGTLYPQKCDLSPDGRWLLYSAMKQGSTWAAGDIYEAISRLPWLTALAAWNAGTTYTRGFHFHTVPGPSAAGDPDVGDATPCLRRYAINLTRPVQFAVERRRGWTESVDTPPRERGGAWDEQRRVEMEKPQPGRDGCRLQVTGSYAAFRGMPDARDPAEYSLVRDEELYVLEGVQWADWDSTGRLLTATTTGRLEVHGVDDRSGAPSGDADFSVDLSTARPDPQPPPDWAQEW